VLASNVNIADSLAAAFVRVIVFPLYSKSTSKEVTFVKPKFLISTEGFLV
jgi:hypothetical protein